MISECENSNVKCQMLNILHLTLNVCMQLNYAVQLQVTSYKLQEKSDFNI